MRQEVGVRDEQPNMCVKLHVPRVWTRLAFCIQNRGKDESLRRPLAVLKETPTTSQEHKKKRTRSQLHFPVCSHPPTPAPDQVAKCGLIISTRNYRMYGGVSCWPMKKKKKRSNPEISRYLPRSVSCRFPYPASSARHLRHRHLRSGSCGRRCSLVNGWSTR